MATRYVERQSGTTFLSDAHTDSAGNVAPIGVDSSTEKLNFYDKTNGAVRSLADSKNGLTADASTNLILRTALLSNSVRLNSITDTTTASGDCIGFQSKPRTGVAGSQSIYGCQISAQISNGIALSGSGSVIGGHIDVYVRGTSAGTIAGDVRGLQIELTTDDAGTRDITGYVTALRIRKVFSAGTVTGVQSVFRVEAPEVQTGSESYDCLFELPGTPGTGTVTKPWNNNPGTENDGALEGYIKVIIGGVAKYIRLYAIGNTAD